MGRVRPHTPSSMHNESWFSFCVCRFWLLIFFFSFISLPSLLKIRFFAFSRPLTHSFRKFKQGSSILTRKKGKRFGYPNFVSSHFLSSFHSHRVLNVFLYVWCESYVCNAHTLTLTLSAFSILLWYSVFVFMAFSIIFYIIVNFAFTIGFLSMFHHFNLASSGAMHSTCIIQYNKNKFTFTHGRSFKYKTDKRLLAVWMCEDNLFLFSLLSLPLCLSFSIIVWGISSLHTYPSHLYLLEATAFCTQLIYKP